MDLGSLLGRGAAGVFLDLIHPLFCEWGSGRLFHLLPTTALTPFCSPKETWAHSSAGEWLLGSLKHHPGNPF